MLFMVIEEFRGGDPRPVYGRFRERGRLAPPGARYVESWVSEDLTRCFQVMDCDSREALDLWIANWSDIVDFTVVPVLRSEAAASRVAGLPPA